MLKLVHTFVVALVLAGAAATDRSPQANANHQEVDVLCLLMAEPVDHFTRIAPPAALTDGRIRPQAVAINVTYGAGFAGYPQAQIAFQHAINIWKTQLTSPVSVNVQADFSNLGSGVLGSAGFSAIAKNFTGAPVADTWFPGPIADMRAGSAITADPGITASFSNAFNWYFGTDGLPAAGQYDFVSVVLHELGHGVGLVGSGRISAGVGAWGRGTPTTPFIYDRYLANGSNQALTNTDLFANNSAALAAQLTSKNVFWAGGGGIAANRGVSPRLFAPSTWQSGSSISHLDDATFPAGSANSLMTHALGSAEAIHHPGPIARGMLADSGWALDTGCSYALSAPSFTIGQPGGPLTVGVTTGAGCAWSSRSNASFITPTANASGVGSAVAGFAVAANTGATRTGTVTISGQTFTLTQTGTATTMSVSRSALAFGATTTGTLSNITAPQSVAVAFASGAPSWSATTATPWLQIAGGSGTGNGQFSVAVINAAGLPAVGSVAGSVTVTAAATNAPLTIPVTLTLTPSPAPSAAPFGAFDTPVTGAAVAGSIAVTGWALDDVEVSRVELWRDRAAGETTPVYTGAGPGNGRIYIADSTFITGARPDIETAYPSMPLASRAGWGYLLLTQGLWNQGNGSFTLHAIAFDRDGHSTALGSKTITVNNAAAVKPFGAIDTPAFGQTVSGGVWNFGWALTPKATPSCGVTSVQVSIDSGPLMPVRYGDNRADIGAAFPGYSNSGGAGGAYYIDTTTLRNGPHHLGWYVVDSCNRAEGIGSRFFNVFNAAAPSSAAVSLPAAARFANEFAPIELRRDGESSLVYPDPSGARVVAIGQAERVEIVLPDAAGEPYTAYQLVDVDRRALPLGSSFDPASRTFFWQPFPGFLGSYQIEFVSGNSAIAVTMVVGSAVQAVIDTPRPGVVGSSFQIAGWAVDLAAREGSGVDSVQVWAFPALGGAPIFLGVADYGGQRSDIAGLFGERYLRSAFSLTARALRSGLYDVVVYSHSSVLGTYAARGVRVRVQ